MTTGWSFEGKFLNPHPSTKIHINPLSKLKKKKKLVARLEET
jgi:hypothetical protein